MANSLTIRSKLTAQGNLHLILCDGATLTVDGIAVSSSDSSTADLSLYAQSTGSSMGQLSTTGSSEAEHGNTVSYGIQVSNGNLTIHGGDITANGGVVSQATDSGISAGIKVVGGDLTIYDGNVTATGSAATGSVGGYSYGISVQGLPNTGKGNLTVNGGTVTATAGTAESAGFVASQGIYTGELNTNSPTGGKLTVTGGSVTAKAGTAKNGTLTLGADGIQATALSVTEGALVAKGGTVEKAAESSVIGTHADIYLCNTTPGGSMTVSGGSVHGDDGAAVLVNNTDSGVVSISGGICRLAKGSEVHRIQVSSGVTLASLLDTGCAFQSGGALVALESQTSLSDVTVVTCTDHSYENGGCVYCGSTQPSSGGSGGGSSGGGSSGGGSSSSNTTSTTVKNPDGSTTTTTTDKKTGTVTETTKNTDGSTTTVETKKDGTVTETNQTASGTTSTTVTDKNGETSTSVSVSEQDAKQDTVTLPIDAVNPTGSANATEIKVDVPSGGATVEIPVENLTPGTVVVIVDKDGNETVIPTTKMTENGVEVTLTEDATIKIIENATEFDDVKETDYYADAVDWASSRGITSGTTEESFGPDSSCTRGQLVTFLFRAVGQPDTDSEHDFTDVDEDAYYAEAVTWAASLGIVDGYGNGRFGSDDTITREQVAVILYRFAQSAGIDTTQGGMNAREFEDYDSVSDYAQEAVSWAVNVGILQGDQNKLLPQAPCTRAQIVTLLYRLLGEA